MAEYKVQFDVFEGPLDLLLYLVKKEEVDIYEVNLTKIAAQFIEYIELMRQLDLEVAGEFLVMASTLMYIKSRELLPVDQQVEAEGDEEEEDPRWELIRQLVEYKKFKDAAAQLQQREAEQENVFPRLALLQLRGGVFELFVFDELADQLPARVFLLLVALGLDLLVHRQQFAALDIHERRGHHEKLTGDFEVELAHQLDVLNELRGDLRQVDLVNVHLLLFHQVQEQVERAFEDLELDFVFCHWLRWRTRLNGDRILTRNPALAMPERRIGICRNRRGSSEPLVLVVVLVLVIGNEVIEDE